MLSDEQERLYQGRKHVRTMRLSLLTIAGICVAVLPRVEPEWPWVAAAASCFVLAWRFGRTGMRVGPAGVRLVKLVGSESFPWSEVDGFTWRDSR